MLPSVNVEVKRRRAIKKGARAIKKTFKKTVLWMYMYVPHSIIVTSLRIAYNFARYLNSVSEWRLSAIVVMLITILRQQPN